MSLIKLTQSNGVEMLVNTDTVTCIIPVGSVNIIYFNGGYKEINVKEDISEIARLAP